ncbi:MAG: hypothetical protein ABA06_02830 [Parcubacteria bacterium C7867-001]|nr:MAG: hypothetical protein ABA06_02830 [Parcubacteria bacterium C7867-001]
MDYQVPQFIEVEDKIFGPFTLKQFIYLAGGAGICIAILLYFPLVIAIILATPIAAFAGALAFFKMNGKTFVEILESGFNYYVGKRLYLWKKEKDTGAQQVEAPVVAPVRPRANLSENKLHELAWKLDIKDQGEQSQN